MVMQGDITFSWYKNNKSTKTTTIQWSCQVEPLICVQLIYWHNHPEHVCLVGIYSYPCYQMTTQMNSMLGHPHAFGGPPSSGPSCNEMHPKSENRNTITGIIFSEVLTHTKHSMSSISTSESNNFHNLNFAIVCTNSKMCPSLCPSHWTNAVISTQIT